MIGICTDHEEPDLWFSDTLDQLGAGRPSKSVATGMVDRTIRAIKICHNCPVQRECLVEGMKEENLEHGVWGGVMSGERMVAAGLPLDSLHKKNVIVFANKVRLLMESE